MEITALQALSPTLLGEMLNSHQKNVKAGMGIYNSPNCHGAINIWDTKTDTLHEIYFQELPEELRKGIHDYTTRLIGEKNLIEFVLDTKVTR